MARARLHVHIAVDESASSAVLTLAGDVDIATIDAVDAPFAKVVGSTARRVVLDLLSVRFIDSSALGAFLKLRRQLGERDASLRLVVETDQILRVFALTGLDAVFPVYQTLDAALGMTNGDP